jgi:hypothetical protein
MQLIVDGIQAELGDSEPAITRKSIDINNPSARFVDITNSFQLPFTNTNKKIFGSPSAVGSDNRSHDKQYNAILFDVFQLMKGHGFLSKSNKNTLGFQIVDSSKDFFKSLDIKLNQISWDDKDTELTTTAIDALDSHDINNLWYWGKACYHAQALQINTDQTTGNDRCKYSRPAFNVNALINRAVSNLGYIFTEPNEKLAISSNHDLFCFTSYQKTINETYTVTETANITGFDTYDFKMSVVDVTNTTVKGLKKFYVRIRGHIIADPNMQLKIHAVDQSGNKIIDNVFDLPTDATVDFTSTEIYDGPTGMTVSAQLIGTGDVEFVNVLAYSMIDEKNLDLSTNPFLTAKIKAYCMLPDLTYLDLVKLICVVYNKYPVVDTYLKTMRFETMANISKINSKDWSDKFIIGSENITSDFKNIGQKNWLKYENDKTVTFDTGWSSFLSDNEKLKPESDYIVLAFGASKDVVINNNEVAQVSIYNDTTRIPDQTINKRLFEINSDKLQFVNLNWENLASNYYDNYFNSLFRIRAIDCLMNLNKLDVLSWNEKQLVYVDYFKTTFRVLEISNFIPGKLTRVKLLAYGR